MKALGCSRSLPLTDPAAPVDLEIEVPRPGPRDLRVAVKAVSVDPVDTKVRMRPPAAGAPPKILGHDAAGVVEAVGAEVSLGGTAQHFPAMPEIIAPQGKFGLIDDPPTLDATPLKRKAITLHWEAMFVRAIFETPDMIAQHHLLNEVSAMIDDGLIATILGQALSSINAANLRQAHAQIESGRSIGKVVARGGRPTLSPERCAARR